MNSPHHSSHRLTRSSQTPTEYRRALSHFVSGLTYVVFLILGSYVWTYDSYSSSNIVSFDHSQHRLSQKVMSAPKVRKTSKYVLTNKPTGIILLQSRYESCTAILIHERLIITEGVCAQPFDLSIDQSSAWSAIAKHIPNRYQSNTSPLRARVMNSVVNTHFALAVHLLDKPLPYVPFKLTEMNQQQPIDLHLESWVRDHSLMSKRVDQFVVSHSLNGPMNQLTGRVIQGHYRGFSTEENIWISMAQERLVNQSHSTQFTNKSQSTLALSRSL